MAKNWLYARFNAFLERRMPEGLFPRALIILVAPVVLLRLWGRKRPGRGAE